MATVDILKGSHWPGWSNIEGLFDNEVGYGNMYHANDCTVSDTSCEDSCTDSGHGLSIKFLKPITFVDLIIQTREGYRSRYQGVCLFADNTKIACTPDSDYESDVFIHFGLLVSSPSPIIASTFTLQWEYPSLCATIEELFIDYTDFGM